jgi:hypothetical protein
MTIRRIGRVDACKTARLASAVSLGQERTNVLDRPEQPKPVRLAAVQPIARARRRYGRILGLVVGVGLLASFPIPMHIWDLSAFSLRGWDIVWRWTPSWLWGAVPLVSGAMAICGALLPNPARGIVLILAGLAALLGGDVLLERWLLDDLLRGYGLSRLGGAVVPSLALGAVGMTMAGLAVGLRGAPPARRRAAPLMPAIPALILICVAVCLVGTVLYCRCPLSLVDHLYRLSDPIAPREDLNPALQWLQRAAVFLLAGCPISAFAHAIRPRREIADTGYAFGLTGFLLFLLVLFLVGVFELSSVVRRSTSDLLHGFGAILHFELARLGAVALLASGYGSLWLRDPIRAGPSAEGIIT